jgi:ubiquinone biosynthesis protein COQ9
MHHLPGFHGLWINCKHSNDTTQGGCSSCGEEGNTSEKEKKIKYKILEASLPFVCEHGWTKNAISEGLKLEFKSV